MISYSLFLSENLIRISLLFFLRTTSPNPLKTPKSPSAARLALSAVPVFGSSACPLASDEAAGAWVLHHLLVLMASLELLELLELLGQLD